VVFKEGANARIVEERDVEDETGKTLFIVERLRKANDSLEKRGGSMRYGLGLKPGDSV
jgi:hypothetical protein